MSQKLIILLLLSACLVGEKAAAQSSISLNASLSHSKFSNTQSIGTSSYKTGGGLAVYLKREPYVSFTDNFSLSWNFGFLLENRRTSLEIQQTYNLTSYDLSFPIYLSNDFWGLNVGAGIYISLPLAKEVNNQRVNKYPEGSVETQLFNNVDYGLFLSAFYQIPKTKFNAFFNLQTSFRAIGSNYKIIGDFGTINEEVEVGFGLDIIRYGLGYKL
jgi:hypothetical protein